MSKHIFLIFHFVIGNFFLKERSRMKSEIDDLRRRLHLAERDLVNSKEECILLTTNAQSLEREVRHDIQAELSFFHQQ